jgi:hypothetical protein
LTQQLQQLQEQLQEGFAAMHVKLDGIQARYGSIQFFHRRLCLLTSRHWQHRSYLRPAVNLFRWLKSTSVRPSLSSQPRVVIRYVFPATGFATSLYQRRCSQ